MIAFIAPRIFIRDGEIDWSVYVVPEHLGHNGRNLRLDDQENAQAYARGLCMGSGWPVIDLSTPAPGAARLARFNARADEELSGVDMFAQLAKHEVFTTPDGGMTISDEHGVTIWDEEICDPENEDELDAAANGGEA